MKHFLRLTILSSFVFATLGNQYEDDYDLVCNTVGNKDASEQRIRQAASGYDIWKSNPLNADGGDPGKRKQIFEINCEKSTCGGEKGYYDFMDVVKDLTCHEEFQGKTVRTFKEYLETLSDSNTFSHQEEIESSWFSLSAKYKSTENSELEKTKELFEEQELEVVIATANCFTYDVVFNTDFLRPKFTRNFIRGLEALDRSLQTSNTTYQEKKAIKFIRSFGTHYNIETDFGASMIYERRFSSRSKDTSEESSRKECSKNEAKASASLFGFSASINFENDICSGNDSEAYNTNEIGLDVSKLHTIGSPLSTPGQWGRTDDFDAVPRKRKLALISGLITEDNLKKSQKFGFRKKSLNHVGIKSLLNSVLNQYGEKILGLTQDQLAKDELKGCGLNDVCFGQRCQNDQNSTKGYECLRGCGFNDNCTGGQRCQNDPDSPKGYKCLSGCGFGDDCLNGQECIDDPINLKGYDDFRIFSEKGYICTGVPFLNSSSRIIIEDKVYRFSLVDKNWSDAQSLCQADGGKLFEPLSYSHNKAVSDEVRKIYGSFYIWMGVTDTSSDGNWKYASNGNSVAFTNWKSGDGNGRSQSCAGFSTYSSNNGKWFDNGCHNIYYFLCQY